MSPSNRQKDCLETAAKKYVLQSQLPCEISLWMRTFVLFALDKIDRYIGIQRSTERNSRTEKRETELVKKGKEIQKRDGR